MFNPSAPSGKVGTARRITTITAVPTMLLASVHLRDLWRGARAIPVAFAGTAAGLVLAAFPAVATPIQSQDVSPLRHTIVYSRFVPGADTATVFRLDAGKSEPTVVRGGLLDLAIPSPNVRHFATFGLTATGRASAAVFNIHGRDYRTLALPDPTLELPAGAWLGNHRLVAQGFDPTHETRAGLYSRRVADGGGLIRLSDSGHRVDWPVAAAPNGHKFLFFRPHAKGETSDSAPQDAYIVNANGTHLTRLTPPRATTAFAFGAATATWSPDSKHVAIAAAHGSFWENPVHSVYIARADGTHVSRIGPRGEIWDASWSPNGRWIAFSKKTGGRFQLYLMHPDGTGVRRLTTGTARSSTAPTWSPSSDQLVFLRWKDDPRVQNIWAINSDGSQMFQVTHRPAGYSSNLGIGWLP